MKFSNKQIISIVIVTLLAIPLTSLFFKAERNTDKNSNISLNKNPKKSGYWNLPFIHVDANWSYTAGNYSWCYGNGSLINPYIIENVKINASSSPIVSGIFIQNSLDNYFIIRNCTIFNAGSKDSAAGIRLSNVKKGKLMNNTIYNNYVGIHFSKTENCSIIKNELFDNAGQGMVIEQSKNNTFVENTAIRSRYYAVLVVSSSHNNTFKGNTFNNNTGEPGYGSGIRIDHTIYDCKIYGNTLKYNDYGITFSYGSNNNKIYDNIVENNSIYGAYIDNSSQECVNNLFYNNTFNNPAGINAYDNGTNTQWSFGTLGNYWHDYPYDDSDDDGIGDNPYLIDGDSSSQDNYPIWDDGFNGTAIHIDDTGVNSYDWNFASTRTWCSGSGTKDNTYIIKDITVDAKYLNSSILIENSDKYFKIENCTLHNSKSWPDAGIKLLNTKEGTLFNNTISNNEGHGIILTSNSENNEIIENKVCNNTNGLYMSNSKFNTFTNNEFYNNSRGITLYGTNLNNTIQENEIYNNTDHGILVQSYCENNTITNNEIKDSPIGLEFDMNCDNNFIIGNTFLRCKSHGIYIATNNANNSIFNNIFTENTVNAYDNGSSNKWNKGTLGNYWHDYPGVDANDDGIGDTPYIISGPIGAKDYYPIWSDGDNIPIIAITTPNENQLFGKTTPSYKVSPFAADMDQVWYTLNDSSMTLEVLNITVFESTIAQTLWDEFGNGTITIKFSINDTSGKVGYDEVIIKKDIIAPVIAINLPHLNDTFEEVPPTLSVKIDEPHLDSVWYTLDGGLTNISLPDITNITVTGIDKVVNQSVWDTLPNGTITLALYANDTVGNLGFNEVTINKGDGEPTIIEPPPGIPFGNYYIVIVVISVISLAFVVKHKKGISIK